MFSDFTYSPPLPTDVDASEIRVKPVDGGFLFSGPWGVSGAQSMDFLLGFTVTSQTGAPILGSRLEIGDPDGVRDGGTIFITERQCLNGTFQGNGACNGTQQGLFAFASEDDMERKGAVHEVLYGIPGVTSVSVMKDIQLHANGGQAAFSMLYNTFTGEENGGGGPGAIPEPGSMLLMGSALIAVSVLIRRRCNKAS